MSQKELHRLEIPQQVSHKKLKQTQAAEILRVNSKTS